MSHPPQRYPVDPSRVQVTAELPSALPPPPAPPPLRRRPTGTSTEWPAAAQAQQEQPMPSFAEDGAPYSYEEPDLVIPLVPGPYASRPAASDPDPEFTRRDGRFARLKSRFTEWRTAKPRAFLVAVVTSVAAVSAASGYSVGAKPWATSNKARPALVGKAPAKAKVGGANAGRTPSSARSPQVAAARPAVTKAETTAAQKPKTVLALAPGGAQVQPASLKLAAATPAMPRSNVTNHLVAKAKLGAASNTQARVTSPAAPRSGLKGKPAPAKASKVSANAAHKATGAKTQMRSASPAKAGAQGKGLNKPVQSKKAAPRQSKGD